MARDYFCFQDKAKVYVEIHENGETLIFVRSKSGLTLRVETTLWQLLRDTLIQCNLRRR